MGGWRSVNADDRLRALGPYARAAWAVRRIAGDRLNRIWDVGVIVLGIAALAFLARIATNTGGWETSLIAIALAAAIAGATWWTRSRPEVSA
jgi:cyanate permease